MKKTAVVLVFLMVAISFTVMAADKPKIGIIQITLEHEYQLILHQGYIDKAKEMGADVSFSITEMNPETTVTAGENLIAAGCQAIICAPADPASWKAVLNMCKEHNVFCLNDGSPQEEGPDHVAFIGTKSYSGGQKAGEFAVNWINKNLPASRKVVVAHLTLPTFTDCVQRNKGFEDYLKANMKRPYSIYSDAGMGTRQGGLTATENLLQAHPDINVLFGCNDDSALGGMSAMQAAGKKDAENLVIGFDGALKGFQEIMKGGMFRCDVAQQPYLYATMLMERAVKLVKGQAKLADYVKEGTILIDTPVVTASNAQEWYDKYAKLMPKK
jgi:ribose transport system substrate-binding protein